MLICPNCKNEYREGIKICPDCKCELTESEQPARQIPLVRGNEMVDEDVLLRLKNAMEQGDDIHPALSGVEVRYNVMAQEHELLVREQDAEEAAKIAQGFFLALEEKRREELRQEMTREAAGFLAEDEEPEDAAEDAVSVSVSNSFVDSDERAKENRSAMWSLFFVGGLGLVFVALGFSGVLPIRVGNSYLFYGVMCAVFLLFIVMGFVSMKSARSYSEKAQSENTLRDTLKQWCLSNLSAAEIDKTIHADREPSEEVLYFKRFEYIKTKLNRQFLNLDQNFLNKFIDENVYESIFPQEGQE